MKRECIWPCDTPIRVFHSQDVQDSYWLRREVNEKAWVPQKESNNAIWSDDSRPGLQQRIFKSRDVFLSAADSELRHACVRCHALGPWRNLSGLSTVVRSPILRKRKNLCAGSNLARGAAISSLWRQ